MPSKALDGDRSHRLVSRRFVAYRGHWVRSLMIHGNLNGPMITIVTVIKQKRRVNEVLDT